MYTLKLHLQLALAALLALPNLFLVLFGLQSAPPIDDWRTVGLGLAVVLAPFILVPIAARAVAIRLNEEGIRVLFFQLPWSDVERATVRKRVGLEIVEIHRIHGQRPWRFFHQLYGGRPPLREELLRHLSRGDARSPLFASDEPTPARDQQKGRR